MKNIVKKLRDGDRRSIGSANEVARQISTSAELFSQVFNELLQPDPVVRMRAADAVEKASSLNPHLLQPYKVAILKKIAAIPQQETRWHVAQMIPRLQMTTAERGLAVAILFDYLENKSRIVRTFAMQALADLAEADPRLRKRVRTIVEFLTGSGTPAMRARCRKLLKTLTVKS